LASGKAGIIAKIAESIFKVFGKDAGKAAEREVGAGLRTMEDVMKNPKLLEGKSPQEVDRILGKTPGWRRETLGKGSRKGQGYVLRHYNERGNPTGPQLRWHPGGGHHGPDPYWRVKGNQGDLGGIIPGGRSEA
jgi:hypothetical protein